jgi:chromosome segregation ATPase
MWDDDSPGYANRVQTIYHNNVPVKTIYHGRDSDNSGKVVKPSVYDTRKEDDDDESVIHNVRNSIIQLNKAIKSVTDDIESARKWHPEYLTLKKESVQLKNENKRIPELKKEQLELEKENHRLTRENTRLQNEPLGIENEKLRTQVSDMRHDLQEYKWKLKEEEQRWKLFPRFNRGSGTHMEELLSDLNEVCL